MMMDEVDAKSKPGPYGRREAYRSYHSTLAAEWKGQRVRLSKSSHNSGRRIAFGRQPLLAKRP